MEAFNKRTHSNHRLSDSLSHWVTESLSEWDTYSKSYRDRLNNFNLSVRIKYWIINIHNSIKWSKCKTPYILLRLRHIHLSWTLTGYYNISLLKLGIYGILPSSISVFYNIETSTIIEEHNGICLIRRTFENKGHSVTDSVIQWLSDSVTDSVTQWLSDWLSDSVTQCLTQWLSDWISDSVTESVNQWLNQWLSVWLSEPVTESVPESVTQWLSG